MDLSSLPTSIAAREHSTFTEAVASSGPTAAQRQAAPTEPDTAAGQTAATAAQKQAEVTKDWVAVGATAAQRQATPTEPVIAALEHSRFTEAVASSGPTTATAAKMQAAPTAPIAGIFFYKMAGIA